MPSQQPEHETFMRQALDEARRALAQGEVPIGAVLTKAGRRLAAGFNRPIGTSDPTAHAEIVVLREAAERLGNYRLPDTTLYVTLEPCLMCVGAILNARVATLVYGADEPKFGAVRSLVGAGELHANHRFDTIPGVLADEAQHLMQDFFKQKRQEKRES
jgi:tRNA(adenine34) deaminase